MPLLCGGWFCFKFGGNVVKFKKMGGKCSLLFGEMMM